MGVTVEPEGKCTPIICVSVEFQVEEGGTMDKKEPDCGQASRSGSPSSSVIVQLWGRSLWRGRGGMLELEGVGLKGGGEREACGCVGEPALAPASCVAFWWV